MATQHTIKLAGEVEDVMDLERKNRKETFKNFGHAKVYGSYYWCLLDDGTVREVKTAKEVRALAASIRKEA